MKKIFGPAPLKTDSLLESLGFLRFIGLSPQTVRIDKDRLIAESAKGKLHFRFSELPGLPSTANGLIFATLKIGKKRLRGFPKGEAAVFLIECHRAYYLSCFDSVEEFQRKATRYMANRYVRTSKYRRIQHKARSIKAGYKQPPQPALLPSDIEQPFMFVEQVLHKDCQPLIKSRAAFISQEAERFKALFDSIESNPLTDRQREACIVDNDSNLVLAGAGTGKTSAMVGKAAYLVESGKAQSHEILLLAFNDKAATELKERIRDKLNNSKIQASTFHSLGKSIIATVEGISPGVSSFATDKNRLNRYVDDRLKELLQQRDYKKKAVIYFEKYLYPDINPFDFKTTEEYLQYLKANPIRSLKGDIVKSHGELLIANFLFTQGIEYEYEAPYKIQTQTRDLRQYRPDFYLTEHDIYIEHYGIDRDKNTAPFIDAKKYNEGIEWKRQTHMKNDTLCLETFHYQKQEGILLDGLAENLIYHGVQLKPLPDNTILETLKKFGQISILSELLSSLLDSIKSRCATTSEAIAIAQASSCGQAIAALDLLIPILEKYEQLLKQNSEIDFHDMIHRATQYLSEGCYKPAWKYILIDEFQDIAFSRANLVKELRNKSEDCALFCVGDDWQSIYRFAGSDIRYITNFGVEFGDYSLVKLDKSYRFNNGICDVATKFITCNPKQIKKQLITHEQVSEPTVSILRARTSYKLDHINRVLERINAIADKPSSVYVLSRYAFLIDRSKLEALSKKYPKLAVNQITMHSSKGKEADFVIVVGLEKGRNGFPSDKATHPLLALYLPPEEEYPNAEERRLFYVAITRAKRRAYLIADMQKASSFMIEMLEKNQYRLCLDEFDSPCGKSPYARYSDSHAITTHFAR